LIVSNSSFGTIPEGEARLIICIVPLYAVAARIRSEVGWTTLLVGSTMSAAVVHVIFNLGGWFT
jgi:hypothetical protein